MIVFMSSAFFEKIGYLQVLVSLILAHFKARHKAGSIGDPAGMAEWLHKKDFNIYYRALKPVRSDHTTRENRRMEDYMYKPNYTIGILAVVFVLLTAAPAPAQHGQHMGPAGMSGQAAKGMGMQDQLTPQQQQTLQKIHTAHQQAFSAIDRNLWSRQIQLQAALTEDKIDEGKVKSLANEINKLRSDRFNEQVKMWTEISKAGLAYQTMRGGPMTGGGMMGQGMMNSCPMMGGGGVNQ